MIGVCCWCGCTDEVVALVRPGGFTIKVCEPCALDDREEHDDKGYEGGGDDDEADGDADAENGVD